MSRSILMRDEPSATATETGTTTASFEMPLVCPAALIDAIATKAAEIVSARLSDGQPSWMTLDEAAVRYRSTPGALRKRAQRDQLPGAVRDGGRWLVDTTVLDAALKSHGKIELSRNGASAAGTAPPPARGGSAPHAF